jgi:hypothetical protein
MDLPHTVFRRFGGRRRAVVAAGAAALAAGVLPVGATLGASAATRAPAAPVQIVAPGSGALVTGGTARLALRVAPGTTRLQARLNGADITRAFRSTGGLRVAMVGRSSGLTVGANALTVTARSSQGRSIFGFRRFIQGLRTGAVLGVRRLLGASSGGPLQITVATATVGDPVFQATLNGRRIDSAFGLPGPLRIGGLGANDGLRFGRNNLRLVLYNNNGRYNIVSRTLVVPGNRPIAGAGPDRFAQVGSTTRLSGRSSRPAKPRASLSYRWRIVGAPRGSRARLGRAGTASPSLRPDRIGPYLIELTVAERFGGARRVSRDRVVVDSTPDPFPTIGVRFTTLDSSGRMVINGQPVANTGGSSNISLVVLSRTDRSVISSSNAYDPSPAAIGRLGNKVDEVVDGKSSEYNLVAITGTAGVQTGALPKFEAILKRIGVSVSGEDRAGLTAGKRFSVIGVPFAPDGSGYVSVDPASREACNEDAPPEGDLTGYLQKQYTTSPPTYGLAFDEYPHFDTRLPNPPANGNAMSVNGVTYRATLPEGSAGLHILALDRRTLEPLQFETVPFPIQQCTDFNFAVPTNTGNLAEDKIRQGNAAGLLKQAIDEGALVLVQSIGTPKPTTSEWTGIADQLVRIGGNRAVFNAIGNGSPDAGQGVYALVGSTSGTAAEASQPLKSRPGRLLGALERNRTASFEPMLADNLAGTINQQLIDIAYQPSRPFTPAFSTTGERNADLWLTQQMHLTPGDVRRDFVIDYTSNWGQAATELSAAQYPGKLEENPFSEAEFNKVKAALKNDVSAYNRVRHYLDEVRAPIEQSGLPAYIDLQKIGSDINNAIAPRAQAAGKFDSLLMSIFNVNNLPLPPDERAVVSTIANVLSQVTIQSTPDGSPVGGDVNAQASDLAAQLVTRMDQARRGLLGLTRIIAGDGGKLTDMAARLNDPGWKLPIEAESDASDAFRKSASRWFWSSLLPAAYQLWQLRGVFHAEDYTCKSAGQQHVFHNESAEGQDLQIVGFSGNPPPAPIPLTVALGRNIRFHAAQPFAEVPPGDLLRPLFQPADQPARFPKGLGMYKPYLYSSANFPANVAPDSGSDCS